MIVVLGGGPAGRTAAITLALGGREVTLVEKNGIGGQCLHYGCMVVCALNEAARSVTSARHLHELGIVDAVPCIRFPRLLSEMKAVQDQIAGILDAETRGAGVTILYGKEGRIDGKSVFIDGESIPADAIVAATGSRPAIPDVPGIKAEGIYTPHTISLMPELPEEMVIIGGGIMAAEFSYIFQEFGSHIHLVSRSALLKNLDPKLLPLVRKELEHTCIHENTTLLSIDREDEISLVHLRGCDGSFEIPCDAVFIAAGLVPRSEMLTGVQKRGNGEVVVDMRMRTSVEGVYACGDVTGSPLLTPVARREGIVAAENILGRDEVMDYTAIPQSMSLFNEYAFVETDTSCAATASLPGPAGPGTFWSVPSGMTGFAKVSIDPETGKLCGVEAVGPAAGVITAYQAFLMREGIGVHEFEKFMEVHPMTDGVYPLMKFLAGKLKQGKPSSQ
ncbi:MAG: NAD(P)/FAD-dependent oxidoreductase [Methanoregulaceae archaeon]|nr:NAD(P)/FAD-dependent oxidoreductase [Methanoregulaceae archaeon]